MQRGGNSKNQKEILETKITTTEKKNAIDGLISSLDMAEEISAVGRNVNKNFQN